MDYSGIYIYNLQYHDGQSFLVDCVRFQDMMKQVSQ